MQDRARRFSLLVVAAAALAAPPRPALTADPPSPPGLDAFSERVLKGLRLRVGPRAAGTGPDGTLHVVYGDSLLRHAWNSGSGWQTETLDATHGRGIGAALAFDAAGDLHVAYGDPFRGELFHGEKSGTQWTSRLVAQGQRLGDPEAAIAVSAGGVVHVAWLEDYESTVRYADDASGSFSAATIATDGGYGCDLDMALAPDGTPHVVFMSLTQRPQGPSGYGPRALVHIERTASGWTREALESAEELGAPGVGVAASCAFAPGGELHAFYLGATSNPYGSPRPLRHARRTASGWEIESIGTIGTYVAHTHAVADAAGVLHVGLVGFVPGGMGGWLAEGTWGGWSVDSAPAIPPSPAFALASDALHFPFADGAAIAVQRVDRTTHDTSKTTIDRASEPLQRPSIATDAAGLPRIAIVRDDADGRRVEVLRNDGAGWQLEVAATGVMTTVAPSLRAAPDGSLSVAYARPEGKIACASDAGGTWTAEDAATDLAKPAKLLAHAVAPDGTRRVVFTEESGNALRLATEGAGGWTVSKVADVPWSALPFDVEVTADGVTHVVWFEGSTISHASDAGGSWTTEQVGPADGGWGSPPSVDLVEGPAGALWISFSIPWQFYDFADAYTNRDGAWSILSVGAGDDVALGFLPDGSVRGVGRYTWGVERYREGVPQWKQELLDAGPGNARQFGSAQSSMTEGDGPALLGVVTVTPGNGTRVSKIAGAVDAVGACHAAYVDAATGDLRYVTDRDPGRPATASVEIVRGPDSAGDADASFSPGVVAFGDDSGTKFVTVSIVQDDLDEPEERLVLDLVNADGVGVGSVTRHTVHLVDDETTPPPPPPPPPADEHSDYFLPTKARIAADSSVTARGILHMGDLTLEPQGPLVVGWGDRELMVPSLTPRRGGVLSWSEGGAKFSLRREPGSAARWRFDLRLPPAEPSPAGPLDVRLALGGAEPNSSVHFVLGRLDIERGIGWFDEPPLHLESLRTTDGDTGSISLSARLQGLEGVTEAPPHVWINVGSVFAREIQPSEFRLKGAKWIAASRDTHMTVDYRRALVTARFEDAAVFLPAEGVSVLDVQIRVLSGKRDVVRSLRTQVTRTGGKLRN